MLSKILRPLTDLVRYILSKPDERGDLTFDLFRLKIRGRAKQLIKDSKGLLLDIGCGEGLLFETLLYRYDVSKNGEEKKKIINSLKPLYFARSLSFNYHTWKYNVKYSEMEIRKSALGFASQKYYLWGLYSKGNKLKSDKTKKTKSKS